ncbi:monooxygenase [Serinibacter arcticus]|uniref:Monooxygenase n=1 Tax=Serinibacter arcticus TaxID=1655435 RepID=A0A2U1ZWY5_9MICO|nr:monooxygenase [Serinibacter arcticus]PWD51495.1 monooxygenase [Serinibacter arcticus]
MPHLLCFEFPSDGPFGPEATPVYSELAGDIAHEDGLIWKVWTEDAERARAGGVYLFADEEKAARYVEKHSTRLGTFGITDIEVRSIGVQGDLSSITHATLA